MNTRISDERRALRLQAAIDSALSQQFAAYKAATDQAMAAQHAEMQSVIQSLAEAQQQLAARKQVVEVGSTTITIGSTLAVTTAGAKRFVNPMAGVKPTDILVCQLSEYLPDGYGLPQLMCRNAGQLEIRVTVPTIALGTTKTISLAISAIR